MAIEDISAVSGVESVAPVQNKKVAQKTQKPQGVANDINTDSPDQAQYKVLNDYTNKVSAISIDLSAAREQLRKCDSLKSYRENFKENRSANMFEEMQNYMKTKAELKNKVSELEKQLKETQMSQ